LATPHTVGKYDVLDVIGIGGMGTVYRAFDRMLERIVALKIVRMEHDLPPVELSTRFRNEARAVAQLNHPGIVTIYDYDDRDSAGPYIAMEYVDGCALNQYVRLRPAAHIEDAMSAMLQAAEGLIYAHRRGIVHRDIKPSNLLVGRDGVVKITDFGIARIGPRTQTQSGAIMGTPQYMAPEQFKGEGVDHRCDIYAAGAVLYTLLTGAPPFQGSPVEVMYKVLTEVPRHVTSIDPSLPRAFDAFVARALEKRPVNRFASAEEFRDELMSCWRTVSSTPASRTLSEAGRSVVAACARADEPASPASPATSQIDAGRRAVSSTASTVAEPPGASPPVPRAPVSLPSVSLPSVRSTADQKSLASWSREHLAEIERQLMSIMGPMARILVRDAAATTTSRQELYQLLAGQLRTPEERRRFLMLGGNLPPAPTATSTGSNLDSGPLSTLPRRPLTPQTTERASQLLARYLGPIAMLVTRKLASTATDEAHLYALLAERVADQKERERFIKEAARIPKP
jgi:eukaryotic-like serine/threonine-protein kinase